MAVPSSNASRPPNKSAMTELKYRRIADMNQKLRDDFDRPRCKTSDACNKYFLPPFLLLRIVFLMVMQFDTVYEGDKGLYGTVSMGSSG